MEGRSAGGAPGVEAGGAGCAPPLLRRHPVLISCLFALLAVLRIGQSYRQYCQTFDEPAHIACGMEWLDTGRYSLEDQHPPVARVASAALLYWGGSRYPAAGDMTSRGNAILGGGDGYLRRLALARAGILPFFLLLLAVVFAWANRLHGPSAAVCAVALTSLVPPVLAHAGLATTDLPATATLVTALYFLWRFWESPSASIGAVAGLAVAASLSAKFSALLFLPVGFVVIALCARRGPTRWNHLFVGLAVACVGVSAAYRFEVRPLKSASRRPHATMDRIVGASGAVHDAAYWLSEGVALPAPEFFHGIHNALNHTRGGHPSYLLGRFSSRGFREFFLMALVVKTPLGFLILGGIGAFLAGRTDRRAAIPALAAVLCVAAASVVSNISIGVRHVLVFYPLVAIGAGWAAATWRRGAAIVLFAWTAVSSLWFWADTIPYHNEMAPRGLYGIEADSDLDWGQDLLRLRDVLGGKSADVAYFGTAGFSQAGLSNARAMVSGDRPKGLLAVSETTLVADEGSAKAWAWLEGYRFLGRAGRSIRLYAPLSAGRTDLEESMGRSLRR